jgi:hypothetical protein
MRALGFTLVCLATPVLLRAQAQLGSLLYADPVGRGIHLVVVDTGLPGGMTLQPEAGEVEQFRKRVLALAGPERFQARDIHVLVGKIPPAWTVDHRSGGGLIQVGEVTYWRFFPGQVLPVRFLFERKVWSLKSAELPLKKGFGGS